SHLSQPQPGEQRLVGVREPRELGERVRVEPRAHLRVAAVEVAVRVDQRCLARLAPLAPPQPRRAVGGRVRRLALRVELLAPRREQRSVVVQPREVGERIDKLVRLQRAELLRAEEEELLSGEASGDPRAQTDI
ncbi:hypothetical protein EMIHUDRAFT_353347, partial [Emiliania huxleyi CCMP1516]|uniref:Uncharacterized protein n=2 Tax=Emiliania huxleyi TaxID=2903 RepID=A0A0D3K0Z4_EMIH1